MNVRLENVVKKYGDVEAVRGINLELQDGKFTVLVGPSGCGKTTTLRMIAGLESVTSGQIFIGDLDVTDFEPKDRDVSMVFQNYALYPHLSVADNIAFPLMARGAKRADVQDRINDVAAALEITQLLGRKPKELSGGQQQRVAIGRAIIRQPKVFLFDEPLSNLDAKLRVEMRTELLRLQRQLGATAVYVTHDQEEAMTLSDVMVVMRDGVIAQQGKPVEVYESPIDTFVASFVGSPRMNLMNGIAANGTFVFADGLQIPVALSLSGKTTVGIRPEDVILSVDGTQGFEVLVEIIELLGPRAIVTLKARSTSLTAVVEASALSGVTEGAVVRAHFRESKLHLFGADGRRV
ncbi:MAG TPA: sn-glycerol-3-phosphate ABC transporter ATP-binding protein UgpC [Candidatus Nanopelagicaceae bacterium]|nr:sn-glycerol-3-phosphate ABC transporter ATP-binding protein UgpC [Candidatus Nanopelagicaceae bacterium]